MRRETSWSVLLAAFFLLVLAVSNAQAAINPATAQKLLAGDGAAVDLFGLSVSVSGDTAVIGAYGDDNYKGSAYVFVRAADGSWSQQAKLTAADGAAGYQFGGSVAVSEDTAVIGADGDADAGILPLHLDDGGARHHQRFLKDVEFRRQREFGFDVVDQRRVGDLIGVATQQHE